MVLNYSAGLEKEVTVTVKDTDRYGRTIGDVTLPNGKNLSRQLVAAGLAWWYKEYAPKDKWLQKLYLEALMADRGLWTRSRQTGLPTLSSSMASTGASCIWHSAELSPREPCVGRSELPTSK